MRSFTRLLVGALLALAVACASGSASDGTGVDPDDYTTAEKLAVLHGDISTADEFQRVIDCIMASGIEGAETEERVGDVLYASWEESAKRETLLEWAQGFC